MLIRKKNKKRREFCVKKVVISELTLRRLPKYMHFLKDLHRVGTEYTSASEISRHLEVHHTQVRKDLAFTGVRGIPKRGHKVIDLLVAIEKFLKWDSTVNAVLIGVGNMGAAILNYKGFENSGIQIISAFDKDSKKIGKTFDEIKVMNMKQLPQIITAKDVKIGIITTTAKYSQEVADYLVENGIEGIWNFTPVSLSVPDNVIVENVDIYPSLAVLVRKLFQHEAD